MFLNLENRKPADLIGVDSSDAQLTAAELTEARETLASVLQARAVVFILCNNTVGALAAYLNTVQLDAVPVMLSSKTDPALLENLYQVYQIQHKYPYVYLHNVTTLKWSHIFY